MLYSFSQIYIKYDHVLLTLSWPMNNYLFEPEKKSDITFYDAVQNSVA